MDLRARPDSAGGGGGRGTRPRLPRSALSVWSASDALVVGAVVLYGATIHRVPVDRLGPYGLVPELPPAVLAATALLVAGIALALGARRLVAVRLRAYLVVLAFFLYGTPAVVYEQGRYSWLYKTVGVVQYVNAHGALDRHIDIYQNWPGFFALTAWFDKVVGVTSPLAYAKWAQLAFELLSVAVLAFVLRGVALNERERWTALFFFLATNWVAQDYLSPQAVGVVLSLGVLGLALHWFVEDERSNRVAEVLARLARRLVREPSRAGPGGARSERAADGGAADVGATDGGAADGIAPTARPRQIALLGAFLAVYGVLVFVHELSPYLLLVQLGVLALIGRFRPGWAVLGMAAIAVGYLAPRFTFVNQHYGLLGSIGAFFANAAPPSSYTGPLGAGAHLDQLAADALSGATWLLAAAGAYLRWRRGRPVVVLATLAATPLLVLVAQSYGGEGILRVYLFSLPWTAALVGSALCELAPAATWGRVLQVGAACSCAVVLCSTVLFGNDALYAMPTSEVRTFETFYRTALPGPVYALNDNFPGLLSARYPQFPQHPITGRYGVMAADAITANSGRALARALVRARANRGQPAYVVITPSIERYGRAFGIDPPGQAADLRRSLLSDPQWVEVVERDGILICRLPATV